MYSNSKLILQGSAWGNSPVELCKCSAFLEVNTLSDWNKVDAFIALNKSKNVAYVLNYQLKGLFSDFKFNKHQNIDFPLALFLAFDKKSDFRAPQACFTNNNIQLKSSLSKSEYLEKINLIKADIQQGIYYESNFCVEHFNEAELNPEALFNNVINLSNAPYAAYFVANNHHVISGSPEMFFIKKDDIITSAPIKGTKPRGKTVAEDEFLKNSLLNSRKERAENTMIVDLVRHDLSQISVKNSVKVDALCALKSFDTVHQLESIISAKLRQEITFTKIIEKLFPMGSMTGAPKISAVHHSDALEATARCTYSGSIGVIENGLDIKSSVLIRGFYYNSASKYISASVGGAITSLSVPEEEYNECETKLEMLKKALQT